MGSKGILPFQEDAVRRYRTPVSLRAVQGRGDACARYLRVDDARGRGDLDRVDGAFSICDSARERRAHPCGGDADGAVSRRDRARRVAADTARRDPADDVAGRGTGGGPARRPDEQFRGRVAYRLPNASPVRSANEVRLLVERTVQFWIKRAFATGRLLQRNGEARPETTQLRSLNDAKAFFESGRSYRSNMIFCSTRSHSPLASE